MFLSIPCFLCTLVTASAKVSRIYQFLLSFYSRSLCRKCRLRWFFQIICWEHQLGKTNSRALMSGEKTLLYFSITPHLVSKLHFFHH